MLTRPADPRLGAVGEEHQGEGADNHSEALVEALVDIVGCNLQGLRRRLSHPHERSRLGAPCSLSRDRSGSELPMRLNLYPQTRKSQNLWVFRYLDRKQA